MIIGPFVSFFLLNIYRSNAFAGSIAGAVLEAPSEEPKITPAEIPDSVPLMFVVSAKSQEALLQYLNNYLDFCPGCGRFSSIQSVAPVALVVSTTDIDFLALHCSN